MRLRNVLLNQIPWSFIHILLFTNYSDSTTATSSCWFHNIHISEVVYLTLLVESLIVLREQVCGWTYFEIFTVSSSLTLYITPQITFMTHVPSTCKMVDLLVLVHIFQLRWTDQTCPEAVPATSFWEPESSCFEGVYDTVISMGWIIYLET